MNIFMTNLMKDIIRKIYPKSLEFYQLGIVAHMKEKDMILNM